MNRSTPEDRCLRCGDAFEAVASNHVYCSDVCRDEAKRGRERERHRATYVPRKRKRRYQPGPIEGTELELLSYDEDDTNYGFFKCSCGKEKRIRLRYVFVGYPAANQKHDRATTCGDKAEHADKRLVDAPAISTAHHRVTVARRPACEHPCAVCGVVADGNQWAYRHSRPDPLVQGSGKDAGQVYSTDLADYWCLCKRHHRQWDRNIDKSVVSGAHVALAMAFNPYEEVS